MTEAEFLPLFDRYHNMVYRLALSCTRSPQDAEDAVQTVFLKLLDGLRHAFIIGGDLDALGWAEFFWNEDGIPQGGAAHFGTPEGSDDAPWLDAGKTQLNLPW